MYLGGEGVKTKHENGAIHTYSGFPVTPVKKGLPKSTLSICPECLAVIKAEVYEKDGKVIMSKSCSEHGEFNDIISSDARIYLELEKWHFNEGRGFQNPQRANAARCPSDCGICNMHSTHTTIANVDITSRCNLSCNICFADSNAKALYEPGFEEIITMMRRLREERPAPATTIQFIGGEPTLHPRFFDIVRASVKLGFTHIQVSTNGLKLADEDFAMRARDAGLQYVYLQMDGVTDDVFRKIRGVNLLETKLKVIEAARKAELRIIFVPTIIRGVNDHQLGSLVRLAFENLDVLTGISMQPVSFTGRYDEQYRLKQRYTLADMIHDVSNQTGLTNPYEDWFSLNSATPFVKFAESISGTPITNYTCHPHCGAMSLLFVDKDRNAAPVTRFLDLYNTLKDVGGLASGTRRKPLFKSLSHLRALNILRRHFKPALAPKGLSFIKFLKTLDGYGNKKFTWDNAYKGHTYKTFFLFGMHFMDNYNYDIERIRRCSVHYSAVDGNLYPFCTYNSGHVHRNRVEKEYMARRGT